MEEKADPQTLEDKVKRLRIRIEKVNIVMKSMSNSTVFKGAGQTFSVSTPRPELTNDWWKTFAAIPASKNPLKNATIADIRQPGNIHFLSGVQAPGPATRDVTVADNQTVVFPILTTEADNVGWNFSDPKQPAYIGNGTFSGLPVPYQFSTDDLRILNDAIMNTASGVSLEVNGDTLISNSTQNQYRQVSRSPFTENLPSEDDIFGYRASYPPAWVKPPYTQGVQDGIWVELQNLPLGKNTIHFTGQINYGNMVVKDWDNSGKIGDTPLEYLAELVKENYPVSSYDVTYNVDVLSRKEYNSYLATNFSSTPASSLAV